MNRRKFPYSYRYRKGSGVKYFIIFCCVVLICGYSYSKFRNNELINFITDKIEFWNKSVNFTSSDIENELKQLKHTKKISNKNNETKNKIQKYSKNNAGNKSSKIATINSWNFYTIQVASVKDNQKLKKVEDVLLKNKIPFSIIDLNGTKKIQTYCSTDEAKTKNKLKLVKEKFSDAFVSKLQAPVISIKYTDKFSEVENISNSMNKLYNNFKDENNFWQNGKEITDKFTYNKILSERKKIVKSIGLDANKINYKDINTFKENLLRYTKKLDDKIDKSLKSYETKNYDLSNGMMLSSIQEYCLFVKSINS